MTETEVITDQPLRQEMVKFQQTASITISDQPSYDHATSLLTEIKARQKKVVEFFSEMKSTAYATWKEICARENEVTAPLLAAEAHLKIQVARWTVDQARIREEADRVARIEAERQQAIAMEAQIEEAEAAGASVEEIAAICEMPVAMPAPVSTPTFQRNSLVSTAKSYRAEVTDLRALCREVADGRLAASYVAANQTALNQRARAEGLLLNIPGVRVIEVTTVSARTR